MGAVATTFIAGVQLMKKGLAKPFGSITQLQRIRLGKRSEPFYLLLSNNTFETDKLHAERTLCPSIFNLEIIIETPQHPDIRGVDMQVNQKCFRRPVH